MSSDFQYFKAHAISHHVGTFKWLTPEHPVVILDNLTQLVVTDNNRALDGDLVYFEYDADPTTLTVSVVGIKNRTEQQFVGVLQITKTKIYGHTHKGLPIYNFIPLSWRLPDFQVASNAKKAWKEGIIRDVYVLVAFKDWLTNMKYPAANCIRVIGVISDPVAQDISLLLKNQLYTKKHDKKQIQRIDIVSDNQERIQYSSVNAVTIDPVGSTDFDDAFHVDGDSVFVHIADVDHFFPVNGLYEDELRKRLTTIYGKASGIYHMLPDEYSSRIISLNTEGPKKTISVKLQHNGLTLEPVEVYLSEVTICSNYTYDEAQTSKAPIFKEIAALTGETDMHKVVEKLMVLCNSYVGQLLYEGGCPFVRRVDVISKDLIVDTECLQYLKYRSESGAQYSNQSGSHTLLGIQNYTHFTSPIRRYADLVVQRLLKKILTGATAPYSNNELGRIATSLNGYLKSVKRYYRDADVMKLFQVLSGSAKSVIATKGYIVDYDTETNYVFVFLSEYNIEYRYKLFSNKLENIMSVKNYDKHIVLTNNQSTESWDIPKYEELYVNLSTNSNEVRLSKKIIMRISSIEDTFVF